MFSTQTKMTVARIISGILIRLRHAVGLPATLRAKRGGLTWELDLNEGIDLSIFLIGAFELDTTRCYSGILGAGNIALDIGANIGAHTLPMASLVGATGKVIACEPTFYAIEKLKRNINFNPQLKGRITVCQTMIGSDIRRNQDGFLASSWPLGTSRDANNQHGGKLMSTSGSRFSTLDDFVEELSLDRIDLIKLDVDGNELDVLLGGQKTISSTLPRIIIELAPYVYRTPDDFDQLVSIFKSLGYNFWRLDNKRSIAVDAKSLRRLIPTNGGINVLAEHCSRRL